MRTAIILVSLLTACADEGFEKSTDPGSGPNDQEEDMGVEPDETPPGPAATACATNQHACDTKCEPNRANTPDVGCSMGCGGACPAPANGSATCDDAGVCGIACDEGYTRIGEQCVADVCQAVGYSCGTYNGGGSAVDCGSCLDGATCGADHVCSRSPDQKEVNDTVAAASKLGDFKDSDDAKLNVPAMSIHSAQDVDWYTFHVTDGWDAGNPDAHVTLSHEYISSGYDLGWLSDPHDLTVWFKCDGADNGSSVECGEWYTTSDTDSLRDPNLGVGCHVRGTYLVWAHVSASCGTIDDNGTVTVRVKKDYVPMGDTYDLDILVE